MFPYLTHEIARQRHAADVASAAEFRRAREARRARRARVTDGRRQAQPGHLHPAAAA